MRCLSPIAKPPFAAVGLIYLLIASVSARAAESPRSLCFENDGELSVWDSTGEVQFDRERNRDGSAGGALRVGPGARAVWRFAEKNISGTVDLWIYDDGSASADPKKHAAGPMWGVTQEDGSVLVIGAIYAPYLSGDRTYAVSDFAPFRNERPWWKVQYLGLRRQPGWHRWTFHFDPDAGLTILHNGQDVNARRQVFRWNRTSLRGLTGVILFGDQTDAKQTLWVDDVRIELGEPPRVEPLWPPPPPKGLRPRPLAAEWTSTPFRRWQHGPPDRPDYFPIAVWLQNPCNAARYKQAGFNLYVGLWKGPTEEQLSDLRKAGMPVICPQNDVGLRHRNDPIIVGWMHGDEPDNAQRRPDGKGYGPPIPPQRIIEGYRKMLATDSTRPVMLNLGQGVAWDGWRGRGVRTNHPEDYVEYVQGADIISFDIYPAVHSHPDVAGRLWYVPFGVTRLRQWTGDRKIVWNCIECTRINNPNVKPTPQQVKAEVWMSIIFGSRGLIYFVHQFKPKFIEAGLLADPEMLQAVTAINRQVHALAAVINSPPVPEAGSVTTSDQRVPVAMTVRRHEGATYVFAV
ncbi:MAG: hypothetical protein GXP27_07505, partial [Planctomycetes bacterium]|nr:hypothetical protein [Planctomycetota bacterium]